MTDAIEFLKSLKEKARYIKKLQEELAKRRQEAVNISSPPPDRERVSGGGQIHGLETKVEKIVTYDEMLREELDDVMGDLITARMVIASMPNVKHRLYITLYYLDGFSANRISRQERTRKETVLKTLHEAEEGFSEQFNSLNTQDVEPGTERNRRHLV